MKADQFRQRVASLHGKTLLTATRRRPFAIAVHADGLAITPSSGKVRLVSWTMIGSILERFRAQGSFAPVHYHDLTFDSSYVLAILRHIQSSEKEVLEDPAVARSPGSVHSSDDGKNDRNSSSSRVTPVFDCLYGVDPTGASWLHRLLLLGARDGRMPFSTSPLTLVANHGRLWGDEEASLPAPMSLLEHLAQNLDPRLVDASGDTGDVVEIRRKLALKHPATVADALGNLRSLREAGKRPGKQWFVLEGPSRPDALLETEGLVVCVEGKRTESACTTTTKFMTCRSQLVRHMDAAMDAYPKKRVLGLLIVEGPGGLNDPEPSQFWKAQSHAQYSDDMLRNSLPHRTLEQRQMIGDGIIGITTWQAVCAEFHIPWPPAP
jgi:hypothetical protein